MNDSTPTTDRSQQFRERLAAARVSENARRFDVDIDINAAYATAILTEDKDGGFILNGSLRLTDGTDTAQGRADTRHAAQRLADHIDATVARQVYAFVTLTHGHMAASLSPDPAHDIYETISRAAADVVADTSCDATAIVDQAQATARALGHRQGRHMGAR